LQYEKYESFCAGDKHSAHIFSVLSESLLETLLKQTTAGGYGQQGMPLAQQRAPTAQHALAANTVLEVAIATTAAAIFNNFVFIKTSQINGMNNN
jgi:hypothetical protein